MDKKTRVLNAMNGREVDKIPVGFWFHFTGEEAIGESCIDAHMNYYRESNIDFLKIMSDGFFKFPLTAEISVASDWRKLKPLGRNHPYIKDQVERVKGIQQRINGECCYFYTVFAPFSCIRFGASDEVVMQHLKEDPNSVMYALNVIAEDQSLLAELLLKEGGCTGIYYAVQGGEKNRFTYEEYQKWITPSDRKVLDHANKISENNILHLCGYAGVPNRLENWKDYPTKAINWAIYTEGLSLKEGSEYFKGKTVIGGFENTKNGIIYKGGPKDIETFTKNLLKENKNTGIMIGPDCALPNDIDLKNIRLVVDTVRSIRS